MDEVPRLHKGFNRYIVECKGQNGFYSYDGRLWFNRYIVECKVFNRQNIQYRGLDLIDTLWNVKDVTINVSGNTAPGFNRYIVECKALYAGYF